MADTKRSPLSQDPDDPGSEGLDRLLEYTKFHIGVYFVAFGATAATLGQSNYKYWRLLLAAVLFICAGACGGLIASTLPEFKSFRRFEEAYLRPWWIPPGRWQGARYAGWAAAEHATFWLGVVLLASVVLQHSLWKALGSLTSP